MLASGDASKELLIWDAAAKSVKVKGFAHHQARLPRRVVGGCLQILSEGTRFLLTLVFFVDFGTHRGAEEARRGRQAKITSLAWSPDSRRVASGSPPPPPSPSYRSSYASPTGAPPR